MSFQFSVTTERLTIDPLTIHDAAFVLELVNTEGWLTFIGNRNVTSLNDATAYINKILQNTEISYWVAKRKEDEQKIGIVTFIKREYLPHPDIGFAFLPNFCNNGYAFEATVAVLHQLIKTQQLSHIFATTVPSNTNSIKLLKKLGLAFEKEIEIEKVTLQVYGAAAEKLLA